MPSDERYRAWAMAPQPYRILGKEVTGSGEMTLTLAPAPGAANGPKPYAPAAPGQYWIMHTRGGGRIPAVTTLSTPAEARPSIGEGDSIWMYQSGGDVQEVTTLRVPGDQLIGSVGDQVEMRGPLGRGWNLARGAAQELVVIGWESGLTLLRPVIEEAISRGLVGGFLRIRIWAGGHAGKALPYQREWNRWSSRAGVTASASPTLTMAAAAQDIDFDPASALALLAGPFADEVATARALTDRGVPASAIQLAAHLLLQCGNGRCGRCHIDTATGTLNACTDGPVLSYDRLATGRPAKSSIQGEDDEPGGSTPRTDGHQR